MSLEASSAGESSSATNGVKQRRVVSARRLAANRANALKSTGPRTPEGKARSAMNACKSTGPRTPGGKARAKRNAFKHGVWAEARIADEDAPAYREHFLSVVREHELRSPEELIWGAAIAQAQWMLARLEAEQAAACQDRSVDALTVFELTRHMEAECRLANRLIMLMSWRIKGLNGARLAKLRHVDAGLRVKADPQAQRSVEERSEANVVGTTAAVEERSEASVVGMTAAVEERSEASVVGMTAAVEERSEANTVGGEGACGGTK